MTTWKDGGQLGQLREIANENRHTICLVLVQRAIDGGEAKPWPEGEAHFRLILQAPRMLEALEEIAALETPRWPSLSEVADIYEQSMKIACAAIAAVKGENDDSIG